MMTNQIILIAVAASLLGLIPAFIAQSKRRRLGLWWLYGALLFVVALPHALLLKRDSHSLDGSLEALGLDDKALAQVNTREGFRKLAEDAGVKGEITSSGWRPVLFEEPQKHTAADRPARARSGRPRTPGKGAVPVDKWILVGQVFSPAAPINRQDLFAGRHQQMEELIDVAFERGQHAVVFGERGVGKTSMASVMTSVFGAQGTKIAVKVNCDVTDSYDTVWRKVFDEFDFAAAMSDEFGRELTGQLKTITSSISRETTLLSNDVGKTLRLITALKECVIFIDEFERLRDRKAMALFADTLKMLSDHQVPATVIIVGVADNIRELLSEHRSIEPALVQVRMPRMSPSEQHEIVRRALEFADMTIQDDALDVITAISQGLPHFTHLIAQSAARTAIDAGEQEISVSHVESALAILVSKTQETILEAYSTAVFSHRETLFPQVLLAAAIAETDAQGFFAAADLVMPLSRIARKPYDIPAFSRHLHAFAQENRGPTLQRKGSEHRYRFRFANPLLQPYVLMRGLADKTISSEELLWMRAAE